MGTATIPVDVHERHADRIRVFVVDAVETAPKVSDQLAREGYDVAVCPCHRARSLMSQLEERGTDLVLVHVGSSPLNALEMLRAAVTVCQLRSRPHRHPVAVLIPAAESAAGRALARQT